jgi:hypothetical protein
MPADVTVPAALLAEAAASLTALSRQLQQASQVPRERVDPLERVFAWVATLPDPLDRAEVYGALTERTTSPTRLRAARAQALAEAVDAHGRETVAAHLALNPRTVDNLVGDHRRSV